MRFSVLKSGECNVRFSGFGYRSVTSYQERRAGIPFLSVPFCLCLIRGVNSVLTMAICIPANLQPEPGFSRPFKVTKTDEKSPSEFAFGRERVRAKRHACDDRKEVDKGTTLCSPALHICTKDPYLMNRIFLNGFTLI